MWCWKIKPSPLEVQLVILTPASSLGFCRWSLKEQLLFELLLKALWFITSKNSLQVGKEYSYFYTDMVGHQEDANLNIYEEAFPISSIRKHLGNWYWQGCEGTKHQSLLRLFGCLFVWFLSLPIWKNPQNIHTLWPRNSSQGFHWKI